MRGGTGAHPQILSPNSLESTLLNPKLCAGPSNACPVPRSRGSRTGEDGAWDSLTAGCEGAHHTTVSQKQQQDPAAAPPLPLFQAPVSSFLGTSALPLSRVTFPCP